MTKHTVNGLFDDHAAAVAAVERLKAAGIDESDISILANRPRVDKNEVVDDAADGAGIGAALGAGGGLLTGLGILAVPGLGPIVAGGWLAATAVGALAGGAAGGAVGGIVGAMKDSGVDEADANAYAEGVRRGGTLVSVRATNEEEVAVRDILAGRVDIAERRATYETEGWSRFDENAPPYRRGDTVV